MFHRSNEVFFQVCVREGQIISESALQMLRRYSIQDVLHGFLGVILNNPRKAVDPQEAGIVREKYKDTLIIIFLGHVDAQRLFH
jgi:hypothetical protein